MAKTVWENYKKREAFVYTSYRSVGIVGLVVSLGFMYIGFHIDDTVFKYIWFAFTGFFCLMFLWNAIRAYKIRLYIEEDVLYWLDEGARNIPDRKEGSVPVDRIASYKLVCDLAAAGEERSDAYFVFLCLEDGTEHELPPDIAREIGKYADEFYEYLHAHISDLKKPKLETKS